VFQAAAQAKGADSYTYGATCYGVTHSAGSEAVDLQQHHETRQLSMEYKNAQVYSLHCLGSSIYTSVSEPVVLLQLQHWCHAFVPARQMYVTQTADQECLNAEFHLSHANYALHAAVV
jgi:hypothetical protein